MPFFKATCVYFVLWLPTSSPSWFSALIKCLPIFCLWVFLLAHGFSFLCARSSARKILAGLIFSALGDAFLIWQEQGYFVHGEQDPTHCYRCLIYTIALVGGSFGSFDSSVCLANESYGLSDISLGLFASV